MKNIVRLVDALKDEEFTKYYINYHTNKRALILDREKTGWHKKQSIKASSIGKWHPIELEGKPCLIGEPSNEKLFLAGELGFKNGIELMEEVAKIWENPHMHACARSLTKDLYYKLPNDLRKFERPAWLATETKRGNTSIDKTVGFWVGYFNGTYELYTLYKDSIHEPNASICPIIFLPKETMVELPTAEKDGLSPKNGLEISLA